MRNLPDVLEDLGDVSFYSGWENRSRKSGGYNALMGIVVHHTASSASAASDTAWMWQNSPDKPVGAMLVCRDGEVIVGAAGATNCAGKGGPYATSKGTIPLDSGNSNTISIEAQNNGIGERWPTVQQDAYVALVAALCKGYGFDPLRDVLAHFEWTARKIDPAGNSRYAVGSASWNMDRFRSDVKASSGGGSVPEPPSAPPINLMEGSDMAVIAAKESGSTTFWFSPNGGASRVGCRNQQQALAVEGLGLVDAKSGNNVSSWTSVAALSKTDLDKILGPVAK